MSIPENILNTLTDEQKKKIEAAKSQDELLSLAKESGYELTQEQLDAVAGGGCRDGQRQQECSEGTESDSDHWGTLLL